jgi:hypothetical protein
MMQSRVAAAGHGGAVRVTPRSHWRAAVAVIEHVTYRIIYLAAAVVLLGTAIGLWARGDRREDSYR